MFIAALFTISKKWSQSRNPTNEDWIKKMCYKQELMGPNYNPSYLEAEIRRTVVQGQPGEIVLQT
jgi:hypothetical protein